LGDPRRKAEESQRRRSRQAYILASVAGRAPIAVGLVLASVILLAGCESESGGSKPRDATSSSRAEMSSAAPRKSEARTDTPRGSSAAPPSSPDPIAPHAAGFTAAVTALCRQARAGRGPLARPKGPRGLARYSARALPVARRTVDSLRRVKPPSARAARFSRLLAVYAPLVPVYQQTAMATPQRARQVGRLIPGLEREVSRQAASAGLPACGPPSA
jgi:hypothetical protein